MIAVTGLLHVTIVTRDVDRLERFYTEVLGARVVQRLALDSPEFAQGTGLAGATARTVHLQFPGSAVALEITQYDEGDDLVPTRADAPGLRHVALGVADMDAALAHVRRLGIPVLGGGPVTMQSPVRVRGVSFVYVRDPDGNIVELIDGSRRRAAS